MVLSCFRFELTSVSENKNLQCFHSHIFSLKSHHQSQHLLLSHVRKLSISHSVLSLRSAQLRDGARSLVFQTALGKPKGRKICYFGETAVHKARVAPSGERVNLGLIMCTFSITLEATRDKLK